MVNNTQLSLSTAMTQQGKSWVTKKEDRPDELLDEWLPEREAPKKARPNEQICEWFYRPERSHMDIERFGERFLVEERFGAKLLEAMRLLRKTVELDPCKRNGMPVLAGTSFSVAQFLAELADDSRLTEISADFEITAELLRDFLCGLALYLERPSGR